MTTEIRLECPTCGRIEVPRFPSRPVDLSCVSDAEIDHALRHNYPRRRTAEALERHINDPAQRAQTRFNIALGKSIGTYRA